MYIKCLIVYTVVGSDFNVSFLEQQQQKLETALSLQHCLVFPLPMVILLAKKIPRWSVSTTAVYLISFLA